jgi:hypothetical protein
MGLVLTVLTAEKFKKGLYIVSFKVRIRSPEVGTTKVGGGLMETNLTVSRGLKNCGRTIQTSSLLFPHRCEEEGLPSEP